MVDKLQRALLLSALAGKPLLFIENLFGDGKNYWFICYDYLLYNPSSHIHYNEIKSGKCINEIFESIQNYDIDLFNTKLEDIPKTSLRFSNVVKWSIIN